MIARWSRRSSRSVTISTVQASAASEVHGVRQRLGLGSGAGIEVAKSNILRASGAVSNEQKGGRGEGGGGGGGEGCRLLACDDGWGGAMRVFRASTKPPKSMADVYEKRGNYGDGGRHRYGHVHVHVHEQQQEEVEETATSSPIAVVVEVLRAIFPASALFPVAALPPVAQQDPQPPPEATAAAGAAAGFSRGWRRPLSWLLGTSKTPHDDEEGRIEKADAYTAAYTAAAATTGERLRSADVAGDNCYRKDKVPTPPPGVVLRVVYSGCPSDLAALARTAGGKSDSTSGDGGSLSPVPIAPHYPAFFPCSNPPLAAAISDIRISGSAGPDSAPVGGENAARNHDPFKTGRDGEGVSRRECDRLGGSEGRVGKGSDLGLPREGGAGGGDGVPLAVELVKCEVRMVEVLDRSTTAVQPGGKQQGDRWNSAGPGGSGSRVSSRRPMTQLQVGMMGGWLLSGGGGELLVLCVP